VQTKASGEDCRRKHDGIAFGGAGAMAMPSYLDDVNVDGESKQVLDLALEMIRTASA